MTNKNTYAAVAKLLKEDKHVISYRPSWKEITGSVNATILLQQVKFRWDSKEGQRFYKFFIPPKTNHSAYKPGDSWTEELGFTLSELQGAIKRIGKRLSKDDLKNLPEAMDGYFFGYFRDQQHLTWHYFNEDYFMKKILEHYGFTEEPEFPNGNFPSGKSPSSQIGNSHLAKLEIPISILTETPTKTPTDINGALPQQPSFLSEKEDYSPESDSGSSPKGKTKSAGRRPSGSGKPAPEKSDKPKSQRAICMDTYMATFTQETGLPLPNRQTDKSWWWSSIGEYYAIFSQSDRTMDQGIEVIKQAAKKLRADGMTIADPNSLIKTIRGIVGEQNSKKSTGPYGQSGPLNGMTQEQHEAYRKRLAEDQKAQWKPD